MDVAVTGRGRHDLIRRGLVYVDGALLVKPFRYNELMIACERCWTPPAIADRMIPYADFGLPSGFRSTVSACPIASGDRRRASRAARATFRHD